MTEFPLINLGDIATVRSGFAFKSSDWVEHGTPVVKIANVKNGRLDMAGCSHVDSVVAAAAREFLLQEDDILISMTGYIGEIAKVRASDLPVLLNQRVGKFTIRSEEVIDKRFLYYLLTWSQVRSAIEGLGYGSAQPNVSPALIHRVEVPLPNLPRQKEIASLLGALDDKIDINRRMNETLEAMARAIFKDWFVEFGPVRAKMEGSDPPGLGQEVAVLFPDQIGDNGVPEGWASVPLDEIASFLNGIALQKWPAEGNAFLPVIKIAQLRAGATTGSDTASTNIPQQYVVRDGDVLFSWSGSLMHRVWTAGEGALNQHLFKVTSKTFPKWFYYHWIGLHMPAFQAVAASKATTMGHIQRHHLTQALTCVPTEAVMKVADAFIRPLFEKAIANDRESRTLGTLRDLILPKLMSGELRVRDAENLVEQAA